MFVPPVARSVFRIITSLRIGGFAFAIARAAATEPTNELRAGPVCTVKREVFVPSTTPGVAPVVNVKYLGPGLRRREIRGEQGKSDLAEKIMVRFSEDNGHSWTPLAPLENGPDSLRQSTSSREDLSFAVNFDPCSERCSAAIRSIKPLRRARTAAAFRLGGWKA